MVNRASKVVQTLRDTQYTDPITLRAVPVFAAHAPEMATIAWCKMFEALRRMHFFPEVSDDGSQYIDRTPGGSGAAPIQHRASATIGVAPEGHPATVTVHLCEAPGAFVCATNHFLRTERPWMEWQWVAMTLNMYHEGQDTTEMVDDDRLLVQTKDNWYFGPDNSGAPPSLRQLQCPADVYVGFLSCRYINHD